MQEKMHRRITAMHPMYRQSHNVAPSLGEHPVAREARDAIQRDAPPLCLLSPYPRMSGTVSILSLEIKPERFPGRVQPGGRVAVCAGDIPACPFAAQRM